MILFNEKVPRNMYNSLDKHTQFIQQRKIILYFVNDVVLCSLCWYIVLKCNSNLRRMYNVQVLKLNLL